MERAEVIADGVIQNEAEAGNDDGWGRNRGEDSTHRPIKTKGSWAYARRTLSSRTPVDSVEALVVPVRPLAEMAAGMVAEYYSEEETRKLAPDFVELIQKTGIKRSSSKKSERAQKKMRWEDMKKKFIEAGELTTGGIGEEEETVEEKPAFEVERAQTKMRSDDKEEKFSETGEPTTGGIGEEEGTVGEKLTFDPVRADLTTTTKQQKTMKKTMGGIAPSSAAGDSGEEEPSEEAACD